MLLVLWFLACEPPATMQPPAIENGLMQDATSPTWAADGYGDACVYRVCDSGG